MKDFLGREIELGDFLACAGRGENYKGLILGVVIKITSKMLRVKFPNDLTWNGITREGFVYSKDVVKIDGVDLTMYLLTKPHEGKE